MKWLGLLLVISSFAFNQSLAINQLLVADFLNSFNLKSGVVIYCNPLVVSDWEGEKFFLAFHDASSSKFKPKDLDKILKFENRRLGVIIDLTCQTEIELSKLSVFNSSYNWLVLSESYDKAINILELQNINWDSEVTLAVKNKHEEVLLYDVYKPSSKSKLIVEPNGVWSKNGRKNIKLKGSRFDRRSDLKGITIHAGVVATRIEKNQTLVQYMESESTESSLTIQFFKQLFTR
jgi:uncharacterized protein YqfB (UPF0267 family)